MGFYQKQVVPGSFSKRFLDQKTLVIYFESSKKRLIGEFYDCQRES